MRMYYLTQFHIFSIVVQGTGSSETASIPPASGVSGVPFGGVRLSTPALAGVSRQM